MTRYEAIYEKMKKEIVAGAYAYGERLPSKRDAAAREGVSVVTVEHAYALLEEEGYIRSAARRGYFASYRAEQTFARLEEPPAARREAAPVWRGDFPASVYAKAVRRVLSERPGEILERTENAGLPALRGEIARYLSRVRGIGIRPEQVWIGSGAESLYHRAVLLLGSGRRYAIESPSYEKIELSYRAHGIFCERLALGPDGVDSAALARTRADVLHVTPYHSYPSGITATAAKKQEYLAWARAEAGRVILEDDFGSEFSRIRKPIETLFALDPERVIYINTFSQTISPAVRVGYMLLPAGLLPQAEERIGFMSCTVPVLEQFAVADLLRSGAFERHLNRVRRRLREG